VLQYIFPDFDHHLTYSLAGGDIYTRLNNKGNRKSKITAISYFATGGVTKTFYKTLKTKLDGFLGFEYKNSKDMQGQSTLSYDRSRVVDVGPRLSLSDNQGLTLLAGDIRAGIPDILGGADPRDRNASRIHSGGRFVYFTGSLDRVNRLPLETSLLAHIGAQYSPTPLESLEQFALGGLGSVRGYPQSDATGDSGVNFSLELHIPPYFIPNSWRVGFSHYTWRESLSFVGFIDGGRVFNYKRQGAGTYLDRSLFGAGFGIRFYLTPDFNCQAGLGFPFGADASDGHHAEPYLLVRIGF
jgi:hemolysin activation/secretion protein